MLVAYFSKGADSRELFALLNCEKNKLFVENMNQYDTILYGYSGAVCSGKNEEAGTK